MRPQCEGRTRRMGPQLEGQEERPNAEITRGDSARIGAPTQWTRRAAARSTRRSSGSEADGHEDEAAHQSHTTVSPAPSCPTTNAPPNTKRRSARRLSNRARTQRPHPARQGHERCAAPMMPKRTRRPSVGPQLTRRQHYARLGPPRNGPEARAAARRGVTSEASRTDRASSASEHTESRAQRDAQLTNALRVAPNHLSPARGRPTRRPRAERRGLTS